MLQIDLRATHIPQERRVWRLFPGAGYKFLKIFLEYGVGFLDIPGFTFPSVSLSEAPDLIARIAASQDAVTRALFGDQQRNDADEISQFLLEHAHARRTKRRSNLRTALINFYEKAKKDDIVVIPEPKYNSQIWVGVIKSNEIVSAPFSISETEFRIQSREIRWIGSFRENTISSALSDSLRTTHPFALLERSLFVEVFSLAFGSFIYDGMKVATIYNDFGFLDSDSALLGTISRLSAAACMALDYGMDGLGSQDIISILLFGPPKEYSSGAL